MAACPVSSSGYCDPSHMITLFKPHSYTICPIKNMKYQLSWMAISSWFTPSTNRNEAWLWLQSVVSILISLKSMSTCVKRWEVLIIIRFMNSYKMVCSSMHIIIFCEPCSQLAIKCLSKSSQLICLDSVNIICCSFDMLAFIPL